MAISRAMVSKDELMKKLNLEIKWANHAYSMELDEGMNERNYLELLRLRAVVEEAQRLADIVNKLQTFQM